MMKKLLYLVLLFSSLSSLAQTIKGKVQDGQRQPVIGASVFLEASKQAVQTDAMGMFTFNVSEAGKYKVRVSMVGYKSLVRELTAGTTVYNLTIEEDSKSLEDVVVVGYGTKLRREVTGSISKISAKELNDLPVQSFEGALQAKLPGVQVTTGSGIAGSGAVVRIRGVASISAGGDPLYVVDGIPITQDYFLQGNGGAMNNNPLASINPDDIESIDVLKDAAATAIYGSRGSNGVVIITTKRANKKGLQVSYTGSVSTSQPTALPDMLDSKQYVQLYQEAYENDGGTGQGVYWDGVTNTDWVALTTQTGIKQAHNVSVAKGGKDFSILGNVSYNKNESFLVGNSYDRTSMRLNADYAITPKLKASLSTSFSNGINNRVNTARAGGLGAAMSTLLPIQSAYNPDGTLANSPVRDQTLRKWQTAENRFINGLTLNYKINDNFSALVKGSSDYMILLDDIYNPKELINTTHAGNANRYGTTVNNYNYYAQLNYSKEINTDNKFTAMIANEFQSSTTSSYNKNEDDRTAGFNVNSDSTNATFKKFTNADQQWAFLSYFTRLGYAYKNKMFFESTVRMDGSSKFGKNYRYGIFPAFSASWVLSEESFVKNLGFISSSKLRTSYGKSGNANIPNYQNVGVFQNPSSTPNYNGNPTTFPIQLENPNLRWETSWSYNLGLDMGFLNDRFTFSFEYYNKKSSDVLMSLAVPPSIGFSNYWDNVGKITNSGLELSLTSRNINRDLKWTTQFNISRNKNEITSIGVYTEDAVGGGTNDTRVVVGQPVGTNFLVRFSHVDPVTGKPVYLDINGNETFTWDPKDRVSVGSVLPDAMGGITNSFSYKNFDFSFLFNFVLGGDVYNSSSKRQLGVVTNWNMTTDIFDRWQKPGDIAKYPRLTLDTRTYGSSTPWINTTMWLQDGTFARLRNVTLGYSLPKTITKKLKIQSFRMSLIGTNLLTFTKYTGLDPEIARDFENATDRNMSPNITYLTPPQEKTYTFQLNITF